MALWKLYTLARVHGDDRSHANAGETEGAGRRIYLLLYIFLKADTRYIHEEDRDE